MSIKERKMKEKKNPNIVYYKTNVMCPKCGRRLYTPKYERFDFHCKECLSDFVKSDVKITPENNVTIEIPVAKEKAAAIYNLLRKFAVNRGCNLFTYESDLNQISIGWKTYMVEDEIYFDIDLKLFDIAKGIKQILHSPISIAELESQRMSDLEGLWDLLQRVIQNTPIEFENSAEEFMYDSLGDAFDSLGEFLGKN